MRCVSRVMAHRVCTLQEKASFINSLYDIVSVLLQFRETVNRELGCDVM